MEQDILRLECVYKSFGATKANVNLNLSIKRGSVHGLAGENGSGKSTLASGICGIYKKDAGTYYKDGVEYNPDSPKDANKNRIAMVVQELGVIPDLPAMVNMYLGRMEAYTKGGFIDFKRMENDAKALFEKWGLSEVPLDSMAEDLSIEQRKVLELARALVVDPDFLVIDEMSQALSKDNRDMLYRFIHNFIEQGKTILIITHDLEEMLDVCDTISVLRDGEIVCTKAAADFSIDELKQCMIGRNVSGDYYRNDQEEQYSEKVILQVEHLSTENGNLQDISFELHKGEILAVCGLSDAGIHYLGRAIFGLAEQRNGKVIAKKFNMELNKPKDVIRVGGAYLSKDRDADGLMLDASIRNNIATPSAKELSGKLSFLSPVAVNRFVDRISNQYEIKAQNANSAVRRLSGGNKQKVNLSRWLAKDLEFIILDCPTRGVDVGVKAYIYDLLKMAKAEGLAVLLISDELSEAMGMADRMLVLREHKLAGILSRNTDFTEEKIIEVML